MELVKTKPIVELAEDGAIVIDHDAIEKYIAENAEIAHLSVRDFFIMLAELSTAAPVEARGS